MSDDTFKMTRLMLEAIEANRLWYAAWLRSDTVECAKQVARVRCILWERRLKDISAYAALSKTVGNA
jgi:hypothetical protein